MKSGTNLDLDNIDIEQKKAMPVVALIVAAVAPSLTSAAMYEFFRVPSQTKKCYLEVRFRHSTTRHSRKPHNIQSSSLVIKYKVFY